MSELADQSVQMVVTSPPYWQLKDYGTSNQIGFHQSYEQYINHLNLVWKECHRVLENGCRLCINIGDQYARSVYYGRYKVIPIRTEIIKFCETIGFDYMGAIIWQKVSTTNTSGGASIMGSFPFPRNGILKLDYEFILIFKKPGKTKKIDKAIKEQSRMTTKEWNTYFTGHWLFPGVRQKHHIAMFPPELPHRLTKMFTFVGDTVLDPFAGSGTSNLAAKELGRNSVGYEINPEFVAIIKEKMRADTSDHAIHTLECKQQILDGIDFKKEVESLPYIFKDPIPLNPKINIKDQQFGSVLDKDSKKREEYFRIKEIVSPTHLILNNDQHIRLIGIVENKTKKAEAIAFLEKRLNKQRVFLRQDKKYPTTDDQIFCYLYLQNKTFINAHLIKNDLVKVDEVGDFKYKKRFLKYRV